MGQVRRYPSATQGITTRVDMTLMLKGLLHGAGAGNMQSRPILAVHCEERVPRCLRLVDGRADPLADLAVRRPNSA
jgi:hypothetical protein